MFTTTARFSRSKADLKASGQKSFDDDPGWDGIEHDLLPKIPIATLREFLKEKRETGVFVNKWGPTTKSGDRVNKLSRDSKVSEFFLPRTCALSVLQRINESVRVCARHI